jgi:Aldo/keto reductase family
VYGDGRSEQIIGSFLTEMRAPVMVATKMGRRLAQVPENYTMANFRAWTERSRTNLQTDTLPGRDRLGDAAARRHGGHPGRPQRRPSPRQRRSGEARTAGTGTAGQREEAVRRATPGGHSQPLVTISNDRMDRGVGQPTPTSAARTHSRLATRSRVS